jgi:hypothetical protein
LKHELVATDSDGKAGGTFPANVTAVTELWLTTRHHKDEKRFHLYDAHGIREGASQLWRKDSRKT